jgi:altronate hydrolase
MQNNVLQIDPRDNLIIALAHLRAGANLVLFTTGLGTPTGNPIAPVVKLSTNSALLQKMSGIIDVNTGGIISGDSTIEQMGESILESVIDVASGSIRTKAELASQEDFIPWNLGVAL